MARRGSGWLIGKHFSISSLQIFAVLCSMLFLLQGCLPLFVAAGAGAGYLAADKQAAHNVDKFFQDLGRSIKTSSHRLYSGGKSQKSSRPNQGSSPSVHLQKASLSPANAAQGSSITAVTIYDVSGRDSEELTVVERKELWFNNKRIAVLQDEAVSRESGTWKSRLVFKVPDSAKKGTYTVKQIISFNDKEQKSQKQFNVL